MADNIVLKTFKGGNVTPQNDAIIYQTVLPGAGVFKGCEVSLARSNTLHISQGFGMIKGRFFECYETELSVQLADVGKTLNGRVYIHMDLSNTDEPIVFMTETAEELSDLTADTNVNYNNTTYDVELATFKVTSVEIKNIENVFKTISAAGGGGGGVSLERETTYSAGDTTSNPAAPGWCTLYCTQGGTTAKVEPNGYGQITKVGDKVLDGTCVFEARNIVLELTELTAKLDEGMERINSLASTGNMVQKLMLLSEYEKLTSYDSNTMYYCYESESNREIKRIFLGKNVVYATGVTITYQIDTSNAVKQTAALNNDLVASAPKATKSGYSFVGWREDTEADGEVIKERKLTNDEPVTLYAVFKKSVEIYTDPLNADEPEDYEQWVETVDMYYNNGNMLTGEVTMPENEYILPEGKIFCGWTTKNTELVGNYVPGEKYKFDGPMTLYPTYIDREYPYTETTNNYRNFWVPATGLYECEIWGGAGGDAKANITENGTTKEVTGKGGKGGYAKGHILLKKGTVLYFYFGGKGGDNEQGGYNTGSASNGGGSGISASSNTESAKHVGAGGGGATFISKSNTSFDSSNAYQNRNQFLLVAAGGGGGGVSVSTNTSNSNPRHCYEIGAHKGGDGGGERGENGSSGSMGGAQTAFGTSESYLFGKCTSPSNSSYAYAGSGAGWFAGEYGEYGNSGAGGSSYIGNMPTFNYKGTRYKSVTQSGVNEGRGYGYIRYVRPCREDEATY